jgi:hypothetical protein
MTLHLPQFTKASKIYGRLLVILQAVHSELQSGQDGRQDKLAAAGGGGENPKEDNKKKRTLKTTQLDLYFQYELR